MTVQRTPLEHYPEHSFFDRHPDLYIEEAVEGLWLAEHDHDFVELVLVLEGRGTHYLNGEPVQARRGDLFAIPVGTRHIFRPDARASKASKAAKVERLKVVNGLIRKNALSRLSAFLEDHRAAAFLSWLAGEASSPGGMRADGVLRAGGVPFAGKEADAEPLRPSLGDSQAWLHVRDQSDMLRNLFVRLHADYNGRADALSLWSGAIGLLAAVYRHSELAGGDGEAIGPSTAAASAGRAAEAAPLRKALACMRERYAEPLTAAVVAEAAGIGERQLARLFASATGRSFLRHLEDIRVEACCGLLRDSRLPIMDLPPLVGYEQWKSLNRVFRSRMGVSLSEYRREAERDA
jgi:AraC-like DNA-binding protein